MDAFIYFNERLNVGLDEIEDALDSSLGGRGEVTGTGVSEEGSNIDIEIFGDLTIEEVMKIIRESLAKFEIPQSTFVKIDGKRLTL